MNIHEYQAKAVLREFGVPVPRGTGTPNSRSTALAWYSWMFIRPPRALGVGPAMARGRDDYRPLPRLGAIVLHASTSVFTASADLSNMVRSAPLSWISTIRSTPFDPITAGTPT